MYVSMYIVYLYFVQVHSYLMYAFAYDVFKPPGTIGFGGMYYYVIVMHYYLTYLQTIHQN